MEKDEIITQVTESMDWVNSLACSWKPDGNLLVCLDPKDLNKVIERTYHKIPTVEEVTHAFTGSKFFSKLDAKSAFLCIGLDKESSYLTTFSTIFGRYHYLVMPYGSIDRQDAFQSKMDQILEGLEGVVSITDDIIVHGVTEEQHDKNVRSLMDCACEDGLVFNPEKFSLKADSVMFFGCLYDRNGIRPDPTKAKAIQAMPAPTCLHELQEFIGMVTYLRKFIRGLSDLQELLCALTKKDAWFKWTPSHEQQFNIIKNSISSTTTLHYFDTNKPVVLQVDASKIGLGATILQDDEPVAYASKSLPDTDR